jgi:hypothetical protein
MKAWQKDNMALDLPLIDGTPGLPLDRTGQLER